MQIGAKLPEFAKGCIALSNAEGLTSTAAQCYNGSEMELIKAEFWHSSLRGVVRMHTFVRVTKLTDIGGRSAYITNATDQHEEEDVLCCGGPVEDWKPYHDYERTHRRSSEPNNEGRELIVSLPNDMSSLSIEELKSRMDSLAQQLIGKDSDYQYAVHWNSSHTNLHAHIIFSEREKCPQTKSKGSTSDFYDRDIYLTQDGKIARRKADRAVYADGTVKPPIHRKGEPKLQEFTVKNKKYLSKEWLKGVKAIVRDQFIVKEERTEELNYIPYFHEGKAPEASERARQRNSVIRSLNQMLEDREKAGFCLKDKSDPIYREFYKRICGKIQDEIDVGEWFERNILIHKPIIAQLDEILDIGEKIAAAINNGVLDREIRTNNFYNISLTDKLDEIMETAEKIAAAIDSGVLDKDKNSNFYFR